MKKLRRVITIIMVIALLALAAISITSCGESWDRGVKSFKSNYGGGLERVLVVYDYEGDTLATYEGKFDIRDSGSDNQVFFDINGKRVWIQGGIVITEEK